jgi:hypothetical protein
MQIRAENGRGKNENCDKNTRFLLSLFQQRDSSKHPFYTYLRFIRGNFSLTFFLLNAVDVRLEWEEKERDVLYANLFPMLSVVIIILKKREESQVFTLGMNVRSC